MKTTKNDTLQLPSKPWYTIIDDLLKANKDFKEITARVRHSKFVEDGKVVQIGVIPGGKGAPPKVYTQSPVTQEVIDQARKDGIVLMDNIENLIKVVSVSTNSTTFANTKSPVAV